MKLGVIGAGRIGGGIARQLAGAGHELKLSFSRRTPIRTGIYGERDP